MRRALLLALLICCWAGSVPAQTLSDRPGWQVHRTKMGYSALIDALKDATRANGMAVVTQAGPTGAARARGIEIPGNRVIGVFNNETAVRVLALSTAAMIEAPIRFYITENTDGTANLAWKTPSHVFAPYMPEAGAELADIARTLDETFQKIARDAIAR